MKRLVCLVVLALTAASCAGDETWEGKLSDDTCRGFHDWDEHSVPLTEQECTLKCIGIGSKYMLVSGDDLYTIEMEGQEVPDLSEYAGKPVRVIGRLQDTTITANKVEFP